MITKSTSQDATPANNRRELILLGTGTSTGVPMIGCDCDVCRSPNPRNNRLRTGVAVYAPDGTFLIDTSPELRIQLLREKITVAHAVIFTHGHVDHLYGLDDTRLFPHRLGYPLPIYMEESTEATMRAAFGYAFRERPPEAKGWSIPQFDVRRIGEEPFELLGQTVRPVRLLHGRLPVLGYRFNDVAFCTDVSTIPVESWSKLEGLDVLILDALRDKPHPTHFSIDQALEVVDRLKPKQTWLTHISHSLEHEATNARLPANVQLAYDGLRVSF
jgi:phosphoribosyl 1,2-cyclic phosphate phosphodiesterase